MSQDFLSQEEVDALLKGVTAEAEEAPAATADGSVRSHDIILQERIVRDRMPTLETIFVETFEPSHPFGVKAVAEIPMDGVAPAVGNAILDAIGVNVEEIPVTPERLWKAIKRK